MESTTTRHRPIRSSLVALSVLAVSLLAAPTATGTPGAPGPAGAGAAHLRTLVTLDYAAGEHPEGLAVARDGSLYAGMAPTGQLTRIDADGTTTPVGVPAFPEGAGYLLGLAVDGADRVYGAVVRFDGGPSGVWTYDADSQSWDLFAATDPTGFPNGLAFTDDGTLLVSDMTLGTIWAVDPAGQVFTWLRDARLDGGANDAGVNGLAVDRAGDVWFTNSDGATVGRIPVSRAGDPARRPRIVAHDSRLTFADGLALDTAGNAWVAASYGSDRLLRVSSHGRVRQVADREDGLDYTASVAFGRPPGTRGTLFLTNAGDDFSQPSVMAARTSVAGLRLNYPRPTA